MPHVQSSEKIYGKNKEWLRLQRDNVSFANPALERQ